MLAAIFILLAAVVVWSVTGSLPTSIQTNGIAKGGEIICYLNPEEATEVRVGMNCWINEMNGEIRSVADVPLSAEEIAVVLGSDYSTEVLALSQWNLSVTIALDDSVVNDKIYPVTIITDEANPIEFLLN